MPVTVVNDPEYEKKSGDGWVKLVEGALYQLLFASTRTANTRDGHHALSATGRGVTKYTVDVPKCKTNCECLIVISVDGSIYGEVNAVASDWGFGKARATIDAKLYSSLGTTQAQLALTSGDGADSYEASGEIGVEPKANVKTIGKIGEGPLDKISTYSSGPVLFNACYADFSVTAEGSVNDYVNSWCDTESFAEGHISTSHKCNVSAYCICDGQRELIFEWSNNPQTGHSYSKRSALDKDYEETMKKCRDQLKTNVDSAAPKISKSTRTKLMKQLATGSKAPARSSNDLLSAMRDSLQRQVLKKSEG